MVGDTRVWQGSERGRSGSLWRDNGRPREGQQRFPDPGTDWYGRRRVTTVEPAGERRKADAADRVVRSVRLVRRPTSGRDGRLLRLLDHLAPVGDHAVDQAVVLGLLGRHEEVAHHVALDL